MSHDQIWAPWRLAYVAGDDRKAPPAPVARTFLPGADEACFICRAVAEASECDRGNLLVARGPLCVAMLNRYPYNNGHLLIAPASHKEALDQLSDDEHLECMHTLAAMMTALRTRMNAEGFNVGLNLGRIAGAGLPGHLHWHIVPRWNGDTNFMPVLAGIKVVPQSLDALWDLLREAAAAGPAAT